MFTISGVCIFKKGSFPLSVAFLVLLRKKGTNEYTMTASNIGPLEGNEDWGKTKLRYCNSVSPSQPPEAPRPKSLLYPENQLS